VTRLSVTVLTGVLLQLFSFSLLAATITVTSLADDVMTDGGCNLREAITAANSDAAFRDCPAGDGADTIVITATGTIVLASVLPTIDEALSITGPGAAHLTVDAGDQYRFFYFGFAEPGEQFRLAGMSLIDGVAVLGAHPAAHALDDVNLTVEDMVISGMRLTPNGSGAAIGGQNCSITIRRSTFLDNGAVDGTAGAILISSDMVVEIEDSTFENNFANGNTGGVGNGGAIALGNGGSLTIRRSTFSGNTAGDRGGAIAMFATNAVLNIESSTFANNTAASTGGAVDINAGTASIGNSLFAFNLISGMVVGDPARNINLSGVGVINTLGYNAIRDNTGAATTFPAGLPNANSDLAGAPGDLFNPQINTLGDNGGPTRTHMPQSGSPLLDAGSCTGDTHDQRGYQNPNTGLRIVDLPATTTDDGCDIGAVERGAQPPVLDFGDGFEDPPDP